MLCYYHYIWSCQILFFTLTFLLWPQNQTEQRNHAVLQCSGAVDSQSNHRLIRSRMSDALRVPRDSREKVLPLANFTTLCTVCFTTILRLAHHSPWLTVFHRLGVFAQHHNIRSRQQCKRGPTCQHNLTCTRRQLKVTTRRTSSAPLPSADVTQRRN